MKKLLFTLLAVFLPMMASAGGEIGDVTNIGGILYEIAEGNTAYVTTDGKMKYSGDVVIPGEIDYYGEKYTVVGIKSLAFYNCTEMTSITIPNTITLFLGDDIFEGCTGLKAVYISDLRIWCAINFRPCSNPLEFAHHLYLNGVEITDLKIPDGMYIIGERAFFGGTAITSVSVPSTVTSIGSFAFYGTAWLDNQPDGLVYAGKVAYTYKGKMPEDAHIAIADGTLGIAGAAFRYCSNLMSVTIPGTVTTIGKSAFYECSDLLVIKSGITKPFAINEDVFRGCTYAHLFVPKGTVSAYQATAGWNTISYIEEIPPLTIGEVVNIGGILYEIAEGNTAYVTTDGKMKYSGDVVIPGEIDYYGEKYTVVGIKFRTFANCTDLTSITIPSSLTKSGGEDTFEDCTGLKAVFISDLSAWCGIDFPMYSNPLEYAHHLFLNGVEITDLVIPDGLTSIGERAFAGGTSITSVSVPGTVTSIGSFAFSGTAWLDNQPDGLVYADKVAYTYKGNVPGDGVVIEEGTLGIAGSAFQNCGDLTGVTIPSTVTSIGRMAFFHCNNMTYVLSAITNPFEINSSVFEGCDLATLYVPMGTIETYKATAGWQNFAKIQEVDPSVGIASPVDGRLNDVKAVYSISGERLARPSKGLNLIKMADGTVRKVLVTCTE